MRKVAAVVFGVLVVVACGGGSGSIGAPCKGQTDCTGVSTASNVGFCNQVGVCTRNCTSHSDCNCPVGTTNADLANGKCGDACINVGTAAVCTKVCANNAQCAGTTTCQAAVDTAGASLGYSECV